jgi:FkbM family methyltransferase
MARITAGHLLRVLGYPEVVTPFGPDRIRLVADLRSPLGLGLFRYGAWDAELQYVHDALRPGDVFIDGGANVGLFTAVAASRVGPTGRVIACEPVPWTAARLRRNLEVARLTSIVDVQLVALAKERGSRKMIGFEGVGAGLSSFAPENADTLGKELEVRTETLDSLTSGLRVALVKLDLEGAEFDALRGATSLLESKCPFLVEIEPGHLARQGASAEAVRRIFAEAGYREQALTGPNALFTAT